MLVRQGTNIEAHKGTALSRSDSYVKSTPHAMLVRQMLNSEACKGVLVP